MSKAIRPFGMRDKIGYMFGDLANDLFFIFIASYLMVFYTDIIGISPTAVGLLFLIARGWDAFCDLAVGSFIDSRKPSKLGKFRPFLIRFSLPISLFGLLCFTAFPGLPDRYELMYAYFTYIVYGTLYSFINIPYGSMASVITDQSLERTALSTYRTIGAALANVIISVVVPYFIFGENDVVKSSGFFIAAVLFAVLVNILYYMSFKLTTERITTTHHAESNKAGVQTLKGLLKNRSLLAFVAVSIIMLTVNLLIATITPYLSKDYFHNPKIITYFNLSVIPVALVLLPTIKPLVARFGKKEVASGALVLTVISNILLFMLPVTNPWVYLVFQFISLIGLGYITMLTWAMVADIIDYHELITGKRQEGTVYSIYSFSRKLGQALAGGLGGFTLATIGYVEGAAKQTPEVALRIKQAITLLPACGSLVMILLLVFVYNLSKDRVAKLNIEMMAMRTGLNPTEHITKEE
jgi:GPH family glycoside/pentoside/hexuronide:cation symporter